MDVTTDRFREQSRVALTDERLQRALTSIATGFRDKRSGAVDGLPEFDAVRDHVTAMREHVTEHLDVYLERYEAAVTAAGGTVHWARDADEACRAVLDICASAGAQRVTKGKSMASEEIGLNDALESAGLATTETDLGEYILQLRGDHPSHIIAPAIHLRRDDADRAFAEHHEADQRAATDEPAELQAEARRVLRERFARADVGITGANMLIAESGTSCIVTNEGNGDLTQCLPRVHIVVAGIDKLVPTFEDASALLRVLGRSATGQDITVYTTFSTGPAAADDSDGPAEYHVVLVDNGRSDMIGGPLQSMLRCIRCGACMNHCPVYAAVGGHAYGWVYPGPMGAVLTPQMVGIERSADLPNASTFCGRCAEVCPVKIPLPDLMRHWREEAADKGAEPTAVRQGLGIWAWFARHPRLYRTATGVAGRLLRLLAGRRGRLHRLPLAAGWTASRDLPAPTGHGFVAQWNARR